MPLQWFNPAVYVTTDRPGLSYGVSHVEGAAEQFLKWTKRGPKWKRAVEACVAAMEGKVTPKDARKAFVAAAKEERVLRSSG